MLMLRMLAIGASSSMPLDKQDHRRSAMTLSNSIDQIDGPFDASQLDGHWGERPLLIRCAFENTSAWPSRADVTKLSCFDDDDWDESPEVSARLIRHIPNEFESFALEIGPFEQQDLHDLMNTESEEKWTLVVNDVDRYSAELSEWMDRYFSFLPRWRRDDAQVSIACDGGGIGPHVDNYDVFLIQMSGKRTWLVDPDSLSVSEERDRLIPNVDVSILQFESSERYTSFTLNQGDCLYLPPRFIHWGTADGTECMTLSVGCRAPSSADLLVRVAESAQLSCNARAVQRYKDAHVQFSADVSIGKTTRESMKQLVRDAIEEVFSNDDEWDQILGSMITEPVRYSSRNGLFDIEQLSSSKSRSHSQDLLHRAMASNDDSTLVHTPGVSVATSKIETSKGTLYRLYADGNTWQVLNDEAAFSFFRRLERGESLHESLNSNVNPGDEFYGILVELVQSGVLQVAAAI